MDPDEGLALENSAVIHLDNVNALLTEPLPNGPIYVHFDTDIINPSEAPAMNYPAVGGPSIRILGDIFEHLSKTGQIFAVSVSAWNPELDKDGVTQVAVKRLVEKLIS